MGATRNTGYIENLIAYDGSNNIGIGSAVNVLYKVTIGGNTLISGNLNVTGTITFSSNVTANSFVKNGGVATEFLKADGTVDSSTYATVTYVNTSISNLINSAPAALDTLNELATALGNDANFSTTVTTALGNRLRIDVNTQNLTATQKGYGRTNLGVVIGTDVQAWDADLDAIAALTGTSGFLKKTAANTWTLDTNTYLTSYTESDTLATVTGRGSTTTTTITADQFLATNNGNGTNFKIGDDAWLGDVNLANTTRLMGAQNGANAYLIFGNGDNKALGRAGTGALTYDGNTIYHSGNIPTWNQNTTGSAATLTTARTLTIGSTGKTFNGSADVSWSLSEIGAQASLDSPLYYGGQYTTTGYTGSTYDGITTSGYYRINGGGDSRGVLVMNTGGSLGTLQLEASYNLGLRFRNKTDNANWNSFKLVLTDGNYSGYALPLSGGTMSGNIIMGSNQNLDIKFRTASAWDYTLKGVNDDFFIRDNPGLNFFGCYYNGGGSSRYASLMGVLNVYANGSSTFSGAVTSSSNFSAPTFSNETGYPYNTLFGAGADASTSTLRAGSTNGYQSAIYVRGGTASSGNQISFHTASAERVNISNSTFGIYIDTIATKYLRVDGEDGAKVYDITRGFDTGANDEYWIRIYLQQFYYQQNSNDGRIEIDIQWNPIHASFHAYTKLEFNYHTTYWRSPSYVTFSNVKKTVVGDYGGGTYYPASSTPQVDLYDKNDGYLYIRVKGNTTSNNLNQRKTFRMQLIGKVGYEPSIDMGVSAPTGGSFVTNTYTLDQHNGNLTLYNSLYSAYASLNATASGSYTGTSYNSNPTLTLNTATGSTGGANNDYSGIRFSNNNGSREQFFGVVQVASNRGDWVWQSYTGAQYQEGMRLYGNTHTLEVRGDVIAYGSPSDIRLKTIKEKVPNALSSILKLNGYRFDWNRKTATSDIKEDIGVIAQEVEKLFPELARTNTDGYMSVRYQGLTAVLIEAIKEQQKQIEELKSQIKNK